MCWMTCCINQVLPVCRGPQIVKYYPTAPDSPISCAVQRSLNRVRFTPKCRLRSMGPYEKNFRTLKRYHEIPEPAV